MLKKFFDLRFVIGAFFLVTGLLLVIVSFITNSGNENSTAINLYCGIIFSLFGGIMIMLSYLFPNRDNNATP